MTRKPTSKTAKKNGSTPASGATLSTVEVGLVRLAHGEDLPVPAYQSANAAGLDLVAAVGWDTPVTLLPGSRTLVPTGLAIELPEGYEAQVRPRSGLALKSGITVLNSPGTIDADYRGEVGVILANVGGAPFEIRRGDRIAQMVIAPVIRAELVEVETLGDTERGVGGFGSTGKDTGSQSVSNENASPKAKPKKSSKATKRTGKAAKPTSVKSSKTAPPKKRPPAKTKR